MRSGSQSYHPKSHFIVAPEAKTMDAKIAPNPSLYLFEKFDIGVIHLDAKRHVVPVLLINVS
jgi:hypothetical protein